MAAELTAAKDEAAKSAEAKNARETGSKSRSPDPERVLRRALRSPSREKNSEAEGGEKAPPLAAVLEEGAEQR
eukprot:12781256-Heterocapsa_arctica.AAC.1